MENRKNNSERYTENSISDEKELLKRARAGDKESLEILFSNYGNFIRMKANTYFIAGAERDDIVQEGMIGLFKAIKDYNEDKNSSFKTFAELCITRQIITAVKAAQRLKHLPLNSYISLYKEGMDVPSSNDTADSRPSKNDPEDLLIERERELWVEHELKGLLSDLERKVLARYLRGESYEQIAFKIKITTKSVDNALQRIKRKFGRFQKERRSL
jgi:RNA polymerase sporulation-specific sigma factor